jgi:hypothetical protein
MNAYLSYWKLDQVDWEDPSSDIIDYSASQQYHKVRAGDQVYILTSSESKMFLVGRILVDDVVGRQEAATRLGYTPEYEADYYILPALGTAAPAVLIECEDALRRLYTIAADGQPERIKELITGQRFQAMRQITPGSATILDDLLASHAST